LHGADRNALNNAGQTPYQIAVECGELEAADLLK